MGCEGGASAGHVELISDDVRKTTRLYETVFGYAFIPTPNGAYHFSEPASGPTIGTRGTDGSRDHALPRTPIMGGAPHGFLRDPA